MLEARATSSAAVAGRASHLLIAGRFVAGYVLAVGIGAIVFAVLAHVVPDLPLQPDPVEGDPWLTISQTSLMYFILGLVFGIPYTVLGSLAFRFWLPRTTLTFLAHGMLCPAAAILLTLSLLGGISFDWRMLKLLLVTLPAGLTAAYVFGAIGFGRGFGRWRFG
jgi:hypothetical protein